MASCPPYNVHIVFFIYTSSKKKTNLKYYPHSNNPIASSFSTKTQTLHSMMVRFHKGGKYEIQEREASEEFSFERTVVYLKIC